MTVRTWFGDLYAQFRYAIRTIRNTPGASTAAVLSLALGIGANTAIFSFVERPVAQAAAHPFAPGTAPGRQDTADRPPVGVLELPGLLRVQRRE